MVHGSVTVRNASPCLPWRVSSTDGCSCAPHPRFPNVRTDWDLRPHARSFLWVVLTHQGHTRASCWRLATQGIHCAPKRSRNDIGQELRLRENADSYGK